MVRLFGINVIFLVALTVPEFTSVEVTEDPDSWKYSGRTKEDYELVVAMLAEYKAELLKKYNLTQSDIEEDAATYDPSAVGDILITPEQARALLRSVNAEPTPSPTPPPGTLRDFLMVPDHLWNLHIYYSIDTDSGYTSSETTRIHTAFSWWQRETCLTFSYVPPQEIILQDDLVLFVRAIPGQSSLCSSYIGKYNLNADNTQYLNLGSYCVAQLGYAVHEIGHALGLLHEHQRPDRDDYVVIKEGNVYSQQTLDANFQKIVRHVSDFGLPYDYGSIMQYPTTSFAKDAGLETIVPPHNWLKTTMGQRSEITFYDAAAINHAYCTGKCINDIECENGGYQDYSNCSRCICPDIFAGMHCERTTTEGSPKCTPLSGRLPVLQDSSTVCVSTPGYHKFQFGSYQPGDACTWFIQIPYGCRAQIWFTTEYAWGEPHLIRKNDVCADWFEIRHIGPKQRHGERLCGGYGIGSMKYFRSTPLVVNNTITPVSFRAHYHSGVTYRNYGAELCYKLQDVQCVQDACACQNGGHCSFSANHYTCTCPAGFTGQNCEATIDECASNPCQQGSTCTDLVNGYVCVCEAGYTGARCELNIDECASSPCENSGTCVDLTRAYTCNCISGFTGDNCQTNVDDCWSEPCQNNGICEDAVDAYTCTCMGGYEGEHCQIEIDECAYSPCGNGGTCTDHINAYTCLCADGFTGENCQLDVDDCASHPCLHEATCVDWVNAYECLCAEGFSGDNCEHENSFTDYEQNGNLPIDESSFKQGGIDVQYSPGEETEECGSNLCQNGTCEYIATEYKCTCHPGYTGENCETDINECASEPCLNGATCINMINRYSCVCAEGCAGQRCEKVIDSCLSDPCQHGGLCVTFGYSYRCQCVPGYKGLVCEHDVDECLSLPCLHAGTCTDLPSDYSCDCRRYYTGKSCETDIRLVADKCANVDCANSGTCEVNDGEPVCLCGPGFTGYYCQTAINISTTIDNCANHSCENNGTCEDLGTAVVCACAAGFTGQYCQLEVRQLSNSETPSSCESVPCQNSGICSDSGSGYTCTCLSGFTGDLCQEDIDECASGPCQPHGACMDLLASYYCDCESPYTGVNCETRIVEVPPPFQLRIDALTAYGSHPEGSALVEGAAVSMTCSVVGGGQADVKYWWTFPPMSPATSPRIAGEKGESVTVNDLMPSNSGEYTCFGSTDFHNANVTFNLVVISGLEGVEALKHEAAGADPPDDGNKPAIQMPSLVSIALLTIFAVVVVVVGVCLFRTKPPLPAQGAGSQMHFNEQDEKSEV